MDIEVVAEGRRLEVVMGKGAEACLEVQERGFRSWTRI